MTWLERKPQKLPFPPFYNHPYGNEKSEIEQNRGQREIEREARHRKQRGEAENEKA